MKPILYFLRSSEHKIATDMLHYAARLDALGKTLHDFPELAIYERYYGLNHSDLGLYALVGHELAGAAWLRIFRENDGVNGYVDDATPVLTVAVKPKFRGQGIGTEMLEQLFLEAGALYKQISVSVLKESPVAALFERLGFEHVAESEKKSPVDDAIAVTMIKPLLHKEVQRPSDGYDPRRWMD